MLGCMKERFKKKKKEERKKTEKAYRWELEHG